MRIFAFDMTFAEALIQLRAFARQDGLILSLVWVCSFAAALYIPQSDIGSFLALSTPFVVAWRLMQFRKNALDGIISFRRGLAYSWFTFFYASLLFCLAQYIYFRFLDTGLFRSILSNALQTVSEVYQASGIDTQESRNTIEELMTLKPMQLSFLFMMQNIFIGTIMSLPIAAICMRSNSHQQNLR